MKERSDSLKRRGVLAPTPEVIAYCDVEKAGSGANQSSAFRNFAGGTSVRLGAKLSDIRPKEGAAKRARIEPRHPEVVPSDPVIFERLVDKSPTSLGLPINTECRRMDAGGKLTIHDKSSGAMTDFLARARSSGTNPRCAPVREVWRMGVFRSKSGVDGGGRVASRRIAQRGETDISRGRWEASTLVLPGDGGP